MPTFDYRARDKQGDLIKGQIEASNIDNANEKLAAQGLYPISAAESLLTAGKRKAFRFWRRRLKAKDLATFTRQFEVMYSAGLPVDKILTTLLVQAEDLDFKNALQKIQADVSGGARLSQAFARNPYYFDHLYISMLEAGDIGGILDKTLNELAQVLQSEHTLKQRIKTATLYLKIVVVVLIAVLGGMLIFVFPPFADFYAQYKAQLPLPTRMVMGMSKLLTKYWYILIALIALLYGFWRWLKKQEAMQLWLAKLAFKVPILGKINLLIYNARFSHLVAALYRAGLPLAYALSIVSETIDNIVFSAEIRALQKGLEKGESLATGLQTTQYFSALVKESCAVGEQSGKLDVILEEVSRFYHTEVEELTKNFATLIEPILLVSLAGLVLLVGLAVYMPIWNLSRVVLHN